MICTKIFKFINAVAKAVSNAVTKVVCSIAKFIIEKVNSRREAKGKEKLTGKSIVKFITMLKLGIFIGVNAAIIGFIFALPYARLLFRVAIIIDVLIFLWRMVSDTIDFSFDIL